MTASSAETKWHAVADELEVPPRIRQNLESVLGKLSLHHLPTAEHSRRVGVLAVEIGRTENLSLRPLFYAGTLHDRGKLHVPQALLNKTGVWTPEDALALRDHPQVGYQETMDEGLVVTAGLIVRHHTFQPNNYPETLPDAPPYPADVFSRSARVIALADFYDAAHRKDQQQLTTGEEIQAKVLACNPDVTNLVTQLYKTGVFSTNIAA